MNQLIVNHARDNIWLNPSSNKQLRIKPSRLTPLMGGYKSVKIMRTMIPLPNYGVSSDQNTYHVYGLGKYEDSDLGLSLSEKQWVSLEQLQISNKTIIDVYADNGTLIPPSLAYLYYCNNEYLVLAIQREGQQLGSDVIVDPNQQKLTTKYSLDYHGITIRFYHNPLVDSTAWQKENTNATTPLNIVSRVISNAADMTSFLSAVDTVIDTYQGSGAGLYYRDGFMVARPSGFSVDDQDTRYTFRYDLTIKDIRTFKISEVAGFTSTLDVGVDKYLLLSQTDYQQIEYVDDCDFYVGYQDTNGQITAVLLDNFKHVGVKQVTHNAWSISHNVVTQVTALHPNLTNRTDLTFWVIVRQNPFARGLGHQNNRIEDLYHLPYADRVQAMTGANSTIDEWKAASLEASSYIQLIGARYEELTDTLVESAYGYNAMTQAIAKTLYRVSNNTILVDAAMCVPVDTYNPSGKYTQTNRTIYWYDQAGLFLGYSNDSSLSQSIQVPGQYPSAALGEVLYGTTVVGVEDNGLTTDTYQVNDPYYGYFGYRNYVADNSTGTPSTNWKDVTGSKYCTYTVPADGTPPYIQWDSAALNRDQLYPATKIASSVNLYTPKFDSTSFTGVYEHKLVRLNNGVITDYHVPPGQVTVFCNGVSLIHGLDYVYLSDGTIIILYCAKTNPADTVVNIRTSGYMNPQTNTPFTPTDIGFVKDGVISHNNQYNLTDGREVRVILNGGVYQRGQVITAETDQQNATGQLYKDGHAYAVQDVVNLIEPFSTLHNTIDFKLASMQTDVKTEEYLTTKLPETAATNAYVSQERHPLYSPIMAKCIGLCLNGTLTDANLSKSISLGSVLNDYRWINDQYKAIDPILTGVDANYVDVRAHPWITTPTVTSVQYQFLKQINRLFLKNNLDLSHYIQIKTGS